MAIPVEKTLQDLRTELRTRLGFITPAGSTLLQPKLLDSFINEAQFTLWWEYEFPRLRTEFVAQTAAGQTLYDPPDNCDPRKVDVVAVNINGVGANPRWVPLYEGIDTLEDTYGDERTIPQKHDWIEDQLQIWPTPDQPYDYKLEYWKRPFDLTLDTDRCAIDSRIVLLMAIITGKRHYGRDPAAEEATIGRLLDNLKQGSHGTKKYNRLQQRGETRSHLDPYYHEPKMV